VAREGGLRRGRGGGGDEAAQERGGSPRHGCGEGELEGRCRAGGCEFAIAEAGGRAGGRAAGEGKGEATGKRTGRESRGEKGRSRWIRELFSRFSPRVCSVFATNRLDSDYFPRIMEGL
jgi:hypothetical protein